MRNLTYRASDRATGYGVEFSVAQFANLVVHVPAPVCLERDHSHPPVIAGIRQVTPYRCDGRHVAGSTAVMAVTTCAIANCPKGRARAPQGTPPRGRGI